MDRHIRSAMTSDLDGIFHVILADLVMLVQYSTHVASSFLEMFYLLGMCVSQPLILSNVCSLHDQPSHTKMNTLWT